MENQLGHQDSSHADDFSELEIDLETVPDQLEAQDEAQVDSVEPVEDVFRRIPWKRALVSVVNESVWLIAVNVEVVDDFLVRIAHVLKDESFPHGLVLFLDLRRHIRLLVNLEPR